MGVTKMSLVILGFAFIGFSCGRTYPSIRELYFPTLRAIDFKVRITFYCVFNKGAFTFYVDNFLQFLAPPSLSVDSSFSETYVYTSVDIWKPPPSLYHVYVKCESPLKKAVVSQSNDNSMLIHHCFAI